MQSDQWKFFIFTSIVVTHCATFLLAAPRLPKNFLPVPLVLQKTDYSCGAAAVLSILRYWKLYKGTEKELHGPLKTSPEQGTHPRNMMRFLRKFDKGAYMKEWVTIPELKKAVKSGITVILDIQSYRSDLTIPWKETWEDGHYIVAVGVDDRYLYAMDPSMEHYYGYVTFEELLERWHDYENRAGKIWRNYQLAIFMSSDNPRKGPPHDIRPLE